jgi:hypothetical protein
MRTKTVIYRCIQAIGLVWFGAVASVAQADVVLFSGFSHSFDDPGTGAPLVFVSGDAANLRKAYVAGAGPDGSTAVVLTTDFAGRGFGIVDYEDRYPTVSGNTSLKPGDYTLSFDAAVNVAHAGFWLVVSSLFLSPSDPSNYQHFSLNLGSDMSGGALDTLSSWWQLDFNMLSSDFGDPSVGGQLSIANVRLTMIPEPSSLVLGLLPLVGLMSRALGRGRRLRLSTPPF